MHRTARISALFLAVVALAASPRPAIAGTYTVYGCQNWVPYDWSPTEVTVFLQCPGFVVRNIGGNFSSGFGAEGGWTFGAPAGTAVASLSLEGEFRGLAGWQASAVQV